MASAENAETPGAFDKESAAFGKREDVLRKVSRTNQFKKMRCLQHDQTASMKLEAVATTDALIFPGLFGHDNFFYSRCFLSPSSSNFSYLTEK